LSVVMIDVSVAYALMKPSPARINVWVFGNNVFFTEDTFDHAQCELKALILRWTVFACCAALGAFVGRAVSTQRRRAAGELRNASGG